jgi:hypothetical protein
VSFIVIPFTPVKGPRKNSKVKRMALPQSSERIKRSQATGWYTFQLLKSCDYEADHDVDSVGGQVYQGPETRARKKKKDAACKLT